MPRRGTWLIIGLLLGVVILAGGSLLTIGFQQCGVEYTITSPTDASFKPNQADSDYCKTVYGPAPYAFRWDFGDGTPTVSGQTQLHYYKDVGTYKVALTVINGKGESDPNGFTYWNAYVDMSKIPITVSFGVSVDALKLTVNGLGAFGAEPYAYSWDFGDGATGSGQIATHTYGVDGTYSVVLTVHDGGGRVNTAQRDATVKATATAPPLSASFTWTASNLHVDFNAVAGGGSAPYVYAWNFGDSQTGSGVSTSHVYAAQGAYPVTLVVTDSAGQSKTVSGSVNVLGMGGGGSPPLSLPAFVWSATDLKVNFQATVSGGATPYAWAWDFGDGQVGTGSTPVHTYAKDGTYTVKVTVTDGVGASMSASSEVAAKQGTSGGGGSGGGLSSSRLFLAIVLLFAGVAAILVAVVRRGRLLLIGLPAGGIFILLAILVLLGVL